MGLFLDQYPIAELFQSGGGREFYNRIREVKDVGSNLSEFSADTDETSLQGPHKFYFFLKRV